MIKYKIFSLLIWCLTSVNFLLAQTSHIDSIKWKLEHSSTLSDKIKLNYFLASELQKSSPDLALKYYQAGLKLAKLFKNDSLVAIGYNSAGYLNYLSGKYFDAIEFMFKALKIFEKTHADASTIQCLQYIGIAYNEQGMYEKAMKYSLQALKLSHATNNKYSTAVSIINIGSIYYSQLNYDSALVYFQHALNIMIETKDKQGIADAINNVALIYEMKKEFSKALEYHFQSLQMAKELGDKKGIAGSYHNIGLVYKTMNKFRVAIVYLDSCVFLAKQIGDKFFLKESFKSLAELNSQMGNFDLAYQNHLMFSDVKDSLINEESKMQFAEMSTKYESEKKDDKINLLNKDQKIKEKELREQKLVRNGFIAGFAVVLLFAIVFFMQRNKIKKEKQRTEIALFELRATQQQLVESEKLAAFGNVASRMAHEIQNPLNFVNNFSEMAGELINDILTTKDEADKIELLKTLIQTLQKINHHGERAAYIIKQLQEHNRAGTVADFFKE